MKKQKITIEKLNKNIENYSKQLEQINDLIFKFDLKLSEIFIKDKKTYLNKKKLLRYSIRYHQKRNFILMYLHKNEIKKLEVTNTSETSQKYTPDQLYKTIIEREKFPNDYFPYFLKQTLAININTYYLMKNQLMYEYIKIADKNNEKAINKASKLIEYKKLKINDICTTFNARRIAKLVNKLDHMKKQSNFDSQNPDNVIVLKNVVKYYANKEAAFKVLKDIDLTINKGEFVVILGPSGSGKTTLLNIISGMDTATYGSTIVANQDLINMNSNQLTQFRRDNIGYIFQQYGLLPGLTVKENVEIGANLQKDHSKKIDIDNLLKDVGIYEHRNKFPAELSGGQQQRVSIARSMAKNPTILFGDEPTGAIDEQMSRQIMQLFVDINKKMHTTIIIVTHNTIFTGIAHKVVRVADGKIASVTINEHPKQIDELD